jgi:hypothetical protein
MALVLAEAGPRTVNSVDLLVPAQLWEEWCAVAEYITGMDGGEGVSAPNVKGQKAMWKVGEEIGDREGRWTVVWRRQRS